MRIFGLGLLEMIKPYYDHKGIQIFHGDCLEIMPELEFVDLVLTDPPYGIGAYKTGTFGGGVLARQSSYNKVEWDNKPVDFDLLWKLLSLGKYACCFGGNYYPMPPSSCWLVWIKDTNGYFADSELAWTNFDTAIRNYKFRWNGMLQQDMGNKEERHHPTQKPVELFKMILQDYAVKNNYTKIFDAFGGSGTTAIACKSLGLDWCMTELEADYCEIANKRLGKVQTSIFAFMEDNNG